ncbi:MAG TPA: ABC transporter ATP-binding protein [Gemmatimonadaceae bacterium]|nr:ABC transporter ATP-binding protein [Gemmatimonadaceae bacterium]
MTAPSTFHEEEALGRAYDARLMRRLLTYARPHIPVVSGALALLMLEGLLQLAGPLLTQYVIDVAIPARDATLAWRAGGLMIGALLLSFVCSYGETMLTALLGQRVMQQLRVDIFTQLQRLPITFFDRNPVGRLVTRVTSDVESLNDLFTSGVVAGLGDLFTLVAIGGLMFGTDWRLTLWSFAVIPLIFLTSHLFQRAVRTAYRDIRTKLARINAFLQERLTGMRLVQLFGMQRAEAHSFDALNRDHLDAHLKSITYYALYFPAIEILSSIALAVLIVAGAQRAELGSLTVGTVAAFIQLSRRFYQPLQDLSDKFNILQQAMAASERVFRLLDEPLPQNAQSAQSTQSTQRRITGGVTVRFEDVWFAYDRPHTADGVHAPAEPEWVLKGVSFEARPDRTLALVGHTGAGKSTIVNLLLRFYDAQRGRITVNGVDVREIDVDELRALIGYVQQDIFLFAGDVLTNIRLSAVLSDRAVAEAAERVGAHRLIRRLPGGYAHRLGERGATISVGERQLLSFARAIAADPRVLILDEATSAVDSEIEADIQRALRELMIGRTTIAIAHRLSTIVEADEILLLHHGQVRERGTHRELMTVGGLYERLYRLQAGGGGNDNLSGVSRLTA